MPLEALQAPPSPSSFTPLSTHQSQTPASFFSGLPILHHQTTDARIISTPGSIRALSLSPSSSAPTTAAAAAAGANGHTNGASPKVGAQHAGHAQAQVVLEGIDIWVTSENLILFDKNAERGVKIPYRGINLFATQQLRIPDGGTQDVQGLYMQISASTTAGADEGDDDDDDEGVEITLVPRGATPAAAAPAAGDGAEPGTEAETEAEQPPVQQLYKALTDCSNLHPDDELMEGGEEDEGVGERILFEGGVGYRSSLSTGGVEAAEGITSLGESGTGLPPPMPGSGGWITAENVGEFFDEEGNWKGGDRGVLGEGAGRVRGREEGDAEEDGKWQRTG